MRPVGATESIPVDVRVISATHRDLREMMAEGNFREDLYYRICVMPIHVPLLKERREDIAPLLEHHMERLAVRTGKSIRFPESDVRAMGRTAANERRSAVRPRIATSASGRGGRSLPFVSPSLEFGLVGIDSPRPREKKSDATSPACASCTR